MLSLYYIIISSIKVPQSPPRKNSDLTLHIPMHTYARKYTVRVLNSISWNFSSQHDLTSYYTRFCWKNYFCIPGTLECIQELERLKSFQNCKFKKSKYYSFFYSYKTIFKPPLKNNPEYGPADTSVWRRWNYWSTKWLTFCLLLLLSEKIVHRKLKGNNEW